MDIDYKKRYMREGYVIVKDNNIEDDNKSRQYEHRVIGATIKGRILDKNEVVHHLDGNKSNNSPDNLLILDNAQHTKLHSWLDKNIIMPKPSYMIRKAKGCIRCSYCEKPIDPEKKKFCSHSCMHAYNRAKMENETSISTLSKLVSDLPLTKVGEILGLSDNGVRKRCIALGVDFKKLRS